MISHYYFSSTTLNVRLAAGQEPGRLRVMLLASGIPIKTILINQSLRDGSRLKPWFSLSKSARHHPVTSEGRGSCAHSLSLHYGHQGHTKASHPAIRTWNEFDHWKSFFTLSQIVTLRGKNVNFLFVQKVPVLPSLCFLLHVSTHAETLFSELGTRLTPLFPLCVANFPHLTPSVFTGTLVHY